MPRISEVLQERALLVALGLISIIPPYLHFRILDAAIYQVRVPGGIHPMEILAFRAAGRFTVFPPLVIFAALVISVLRPRWRRVSVAVSVIVFAISAVAYLWAAIIVIFLNVAH